MAVKLFSLGLPGSGKSTVARYIRTYARDYQWLVTHCNDYAFLQEMFLNDTEHKFKPADIGGFDVLDLSVFDTALKQLQHSIDSYVSTARTKEIILIEFSRANYEHAFRQFSQGFLQDQDTYFLYLATELDICRRRIGNRTADPLFEDDYPVSEYIFEKYYHQDDGQHLSDILEREYQIDRRQMRIIDNNDSLEGVSAEINAFIDFIFTKAFSYKEIALARVS